MEAGRGLQLKGRAQALEEELQTIVDQIYKQKSPVSVREFDERIGLLNGFALVLESLCKSIANLCNDVEKKQKTTTEQKRVASNRSWWLGVGLCTLRTSYLLTKKFGRACRCCNTRDSISVHWRWCLLRDGGSCQIHLFHGVCPVIDGQWFSIICTTADRQCLQSTCLCRRGVGKVCTGLFS